MKRKNNKKAIKKNNKIVITFPYRKDTVNLIRTLPNRKFISEKKIWICDLTIESIESLIEWDFIISDSLFSILNKKKTTKTLKIIIDKSMHLSNIPVILKNEIKDYLTFTNPAFINAQKMKRYSKHIQKDLYYYTTVGNNLVVPRGLLDFIINSCKNKNINYIIKDRKKKHKTIDFKFKGKLKELQEKAVSDIMIKDFNVLCAPTGVGKTIMALYIISKRKQPTLIIVHTKELAKQWINRISTFLNIDKNEIGLIGDGQFNIKDKINVALIQSLYKCSDVVQEQIGMLVVDEVHRCPANTFNKAISDFNCKYMLGLSATPNRSDGLSKLIFAYLGNMNHEIKKIDMIKAGLIPETTAIIRTTNFINSNEIDPVYEYAKLISEIVIDEDRNDLIVQDVLKEIKNNETCLILSDRKSHCEILYMRLLKYNIDVEVLTGDISSDDREIAINKMNDGLSQVLIATGQLIGEGFDCENLSCLFLTTPIKYSGRVMQYIGRILRTSENKDTAKIYDYADIKIDTLRKSVDSRKKVYKKEYITIKGDY